MAIPVVKTLENCGLDDFLAIDCGWVALSLALLR
jgi:hypothetical protein